MALHDLTPQLRTRLGRVERLVGVFLLLTLALMLSGFIYFLWHTAEARGWFRIRVPYYTYVADATGLRVGTPVMMMGFKIGDVTKVDQMPMDSWYLTNRFNVFIGFDVVEPYFGYIWTDSRVRIGAGDLLGARSLEVTRGVEGEVTVKLGDPIRQLSADFLYEDSITNRTFLPLDEIRAKDGGFWLKADEAAPLQQRLTDIANAVNDALPGVFAMTNQLTVALANMTNVTGRIGGMMPQVDAAMSDLRVLMAEVRPAVQRPGGLGDLLLPTNLNTQLTLTLSNLNPGSGPINQTLSNLNSRMADVGVTLSNVNQQLSANTNLLADANQLTRSVSSLAVTLETLFKRHWLFRSAYRTNQPAESRSSRERPVNPPRDLRRF